MQKLLPILDVLDLDDQDWVLVRWKEQPALRVYQVRWMDGIQLVFPPGQKAPVGRLVDFDICYLLAANVKKHSVAVKHQGPNQ